MHTANLVIIIIETEIRKMYHIISYTSKTEKVDNNESNLDYLTTPLTSWIQFNYINHQICDSNKLQYFQRNQ